MTLPIDDYRDPKQADPRLTQASMDAIDHLVEHGFDPSNAGDGAPQSTPHVAALLGLLDRTGLATLPTQRAKLLVDVTVARARRESQRDLAARIAGPTASTGLHPTSAGEVDAFFTDPPIELEGKPGVAATLLSLLKDSSTDAQRRASLVNATLSRVQRDIDAPTRTFRFSTPDRSERGHAGARRLGDLIAAAAAILIVASVLFPMSSQRAHEAREAACASNMARAGLGFSLYAADNRGSMPQQLPSFLGGTWWDVGASDRSHSASLYLLVRGGYASLSDLSCPGNPHAVINRPPQGDVDWRTPQEVSFSYQLPSAGRPGWGASPHRIILTDKSPVVLRSRLGERSDPTSSSPNHAGRGQNALFGDGSIRFLNSPILGNMDNIWLPGLQMPAAGRLTGRETPAGDADAFVGP